MIHEHPQFSAALQALDAGELENPGQRKRRDYVDRLVSHGRTPRATWTGRESGTIIESPTDGAGPWVVRVRQAELVVC